MTEGKLISSEKNKFPLTLSEKGSGAFVEEVLHIDALADLLNRTLYRIHI